MSCLHTAIPTPSFCSFWHGHPYIPIHFFENVFYTCLSYMDVAISITGGRFVTEEFDKRDS